MTHLHKASRWAGVAAVSAMLLSGGPAYAEANEYFKCTMDEDTKTEDLVDLGKDFVGLLDANGQSGVRVAFLFPLYSADISQGSFFWQATAANFAGLGALNDFWDSDANKKIRLRWEDLVEDCENSSVYNVVRVE